MGEMDACIAYLENTHGDDLGIFNATNAAIDLAAGIHLCRSEGQEVFIWGGSGGAYWGQPELAEKVDRGDWL